MRLSRIRCASMLAGVAVLVATGSLRAAAPAAAELLNNPFDEVYQPEVKVSGNVIVGVMSAVTSAALAEDRLGVSAGPSARGAEVCVRATSNDGIYSSRNHYRLPAYTGPVQLPYRSGQVDVLAGYGPRDLAVSITLGDCGTGGDTYLLASDLESDATQPVLVYLNSFGATDVFLEVSGTVGPTPCEYLSEGRRTTYDFICTLDSVPATDEGTEITIIRERFGREQPAVVFTLAGLDS